MGKPRTLRSSFKAIHGALSNFIPTAPPICMHQSRTDSFREHVNLLTSFDSIYYTATASSSSSSSIFIPHASPQAPNPVEEDPQPSPSCCCPSSCSSSSEIGPSVGIISSKRFFFSPRTSNSIMEEAKVQVAEHPNEPEGSSSSSAAKSFCEESVPLVVSSHDPYRDFRVSMEEMVEAHGLRDWSGLQELLDCYLQLNEKKTHKIILVAFVDLLMSLVCPEGNTSSSSSSTLSSTALPMSPFLQLCSD